MRSFSRTARRVELPCLAFLFPLFASSATCFSPVRLAHPLDRPPPRLASSASSSSYGCLGYQGLSRSPSTVHSATWCALYLRTVRAPWRGGGRPSLYLLPLSFNVSSPPSSSSPFSSSSRSSFSHVAIVSFSLSSSLVPFLPPPSVPPPLLLLTVLLSFFSTPYSGFSSISADRFKIDSQQSFQCFVSFGLIGLSCLWKTYTRETSLWWKITHSRLLLKEGRAQSGCNRTVMFVSPLLSH